VAGAYRAAIPRTIWPVVIDFHAWLNERHHFSFFEFDLSWKTMPAFCFNTESQSHRVFLFL
jgi:hypothetical protein